VRNMPLIELERTLSYVVNNTSKDAGVMPQFVSILNGKGLDSFAEAGKNCISPNPPLPPPPCVGTPPPCVGTPPPPCYGEPPGCYGEPPPCYGR